MDSLERQHQPAQPEIQPAPAPWRPMRVLLFTDTYADVNGPSRFVQNIADRALQTGRDLHVFTSTRVAHLPRSNVSNYAPRLAMKMPGYADLDVVLPALRRMLHAATLHLPDVIHISTPGPVGLAGLLAARRLRCPLVGVYHTDFPAYIDRLFGDHVLTSVTRHSMRIFYARFRAIFIRSDEYSRSLEHLGIDPRLLTRLIPGINLESFGTRFRNPGVWGSLSDGGKASSRTGADVLRVLYCGRVSVEKNLPMLAQVWKSVHARLRSASVRAELVIVGDGPFRAEMESQLQGCDVRFLGFRHGEELATLYASSDLFVFPSVTDTLGQVVMEAQASGLATLVSDKGGPKDLVRHGITGLVLSAAYLLQWEQAIISLLVDTDRRQMMGRAAAESMSLRSIAASFEHFWSVHATVWEQARRERSSDARGPRR